MYSATRSSSGRRQHGSPRRTGSGWSEETLRVLSEQPASEVVAEARLSTQILVPMMRSRLTLLDDDGIDEWVDDGDEGREDVDITVNGTGLLAWYQRVGKSFADE